MTRTHRLIRSAIAFGLLLGAVSHASGQGATMKVREEKPGLFKQAKVSPEDAQKTAQSRFPTGAVKSGELEQEDGKLIYTFDIQLPGVKGIEEVNIDAATGAVLATEHETPAAEAREKAKEKVPAKSPPKKPPVA